MRITCWLTTAAVLALQVSTASAQTSVDDLIAQMTGATPASQRSALEWQHAYDQVIDALTPGLSHADLEQRQEAQRRFEEVCFHAGKPGLESLRRTLCEAILHRLGDDVPREARVWFLRQLIWIGRTESVATLARIMADAADPEIQDLARRALQHNPAEEAAAALRDALRAASEPMWNVALINALGARRDDGAVALLADHLEVEDHDVRAAAIRALGDIGSADADDLLCARWARCPPEERNLVADAFLRCADRLAERGCLDLACSAYEELLHARDMGRIRCGALRGLTQVRGGAAIELLLAEIADERNEDAVRAVAADLACGLPGFAPATTLASRLRDLPASGQVLVLQFLGAHGVELAGPAVVAALASSDAPVRIAALRALEVLGDAGVVRVIAEGSADATGEERAAAVRCLSRIRGESVDPVLIAAMREVDTATRVVLIEALRERHCRLALPALMAEARRGEEASATAACEAIGALAVTVHAKGLALLLADLEPDERLAAAERAVAAVCGRFDEPDARAEPVLHALSQEPPVHAHAALIRVLGALGVDAGLGAVRTAIRDERPEIADAGVRALSDWPRVEVLDELLQIAEKGTTKTRRVLALRGFVRLLGEPTDRDPLATLAGYRVAFELAERPDEKRLVLSGLTHVMHADALSFARACADDADVAEEADAAVISVAEIIGPLFRAPARAAVEEIVARTTNQRTRERGAAALRMIEQSAGYLVAWNVSGPYAAGTRYQDVVAHAFAPELPGEPATWRRLQVTTPREPWRFDLTTITGESNCCVYVTTSVWSPVRQPARLSVGSDDGVKVWVSGELVHTFDGVRGMTPFSDKVDITLREGWNAVMLKVVQAAGGFGFTCGIHGPDGQALEGLTFRATPEADE